MAMATCMLGFSQKLNVQGNAKIRGLFDLDDGNSSIYIGNLAGQGTGQANQFNTFVGTRTGTMFNNGSNNTLIGALVASSSNNFSNAVIIGHTAGNQNTGENAVIIGARAGLVNTGTDNVFIGESSGAFNTSGSANTFMGRSSGRQNTTGVSNLFLGHSSGRNNNTGSLNSFLGNASGSVLDNGFENTFLGNASGSAIVSGSYNTFLGSRAGLAGGTPINGVQRAIAIGREAKVSCSRCAVIGGTGTESVQVGIGTTRPLAQLDVQGNPDSTTTMVNATVNYSGFTDVVGVRGNSQPAAGYGIGLDALATYLGVRSVINNVGQGTNISTYGGLFINNMNGLGTKYGISGTVTSTGASPRYAVFGNAPTAANSYAGYFNGNVGYTGSLSQISDQRLKKNIRSLDEALNKIMALQPKTYAFRQNEYAHLNLPDGQQIGFLSQEVDQIFPELTLDTEIATPRPNNPKESLTTTVKTLNYTGLIPVLTGAIQEQQRTIEDLQTEVSRRKTENQVLQNRLDELEAIVQNLLVHKEEADTPVLLNEQPALGQNAPNPTKGETTISYRLPGGVGKAEIRISNPAGQVIRTIAVSKSGDLMLITDGLPAGVYPYALVVEGKVVETKTMVIH